MRWQRAVDRALQAVGLTHTQYWVLSTAAWLIDEVDDAVSQQEIAEGARLDKATTSYLVRKLEAGGLMDRRPSGDGVGAGRARHAHGAIHRAWSIRSKACRAIRAGVGGESGPGPTEAL